MNGVERIASERARQMAAEGWSAEHDDLHDGSELAVAAACYALPERLYVQRQDASGVHFVDPWPWELHEDKRKTHGANFPNHIPTSGAERMRFLEKAGALIAAEIDRLLREESRRS